MLVACKACGKEIGKGVKKCPQCGTDQRNFFMKHKIITGVLVLVVLGVVGSALGGGDDGNDVADKPTITATPASTTEPEPEPTEKAIAVTAVDLAAAYEANEVKADKTYKGKTAVIAGEVDSIQVMLGQTFVILRAGEEFAVTQTQCFFKDQAEIDKVAELEAGDKVKIQGAIDGKSMNVTVNDCILK